MSEVKTHFKGPGEWRSQAAKLEVDETDNQDYNPEDVAPNPDPVRKP